MISLALFAGIVSAEVNVTYNKVYYNIIEDDGSWTTSTTPITGFATEGYVCTSANCLSINTSFTIAGLTRNTTTSEITLEYPTTLMGAGYGYVVYFFKDGYIGWEQRNITLAGTGSMNSSKTIYLSKKRTGFAPIMNLSVVNEASPGRMIEINVTAGVDADTYAAIANTSLAGVPLNEEVNTTATLNILNQAGSTIYTEVRNFLIPYSGVYRLSFDYNFTSEGAYTVQVTTNVTDAKILNSLTQTASAGINVVKQNLTNYTYALLQNLQISPVNPAVNQTINFSFNWLANYVNDSGALSPVNATVYMNITRSGSLLENATINLEGTSTNYQPYSFTRSFSQNGSYTLTLYAIPNSTLGNQTFGSLASLNFVVGSASPTNMTNMTTPDNDIDDETEEDEEEEKQFRILQHSTKPANETTITLKAKPSLTLFQKLFYWLVIAVIILLVTVILVYVIKFVF